MTIHLDTSVVIDAITGPRRALPAIRTAGEAGHRLTLSPIALFEWLRGPRAINELRDQGLMFPDAGVAPFGVDAARIAAQIYRTLKRPRSREIDIAIAACAIEHGAVLWTLNRGDFDDIPGLTLYRG